MTLWHQLLGVMSSLLLIVPGSRLRMRSLQLRLNSAGRLLMDSRQRLLGCLLPIGSSVVVRRVPSSCRSSTVSLSSQPFAVHRRLGFRLGCLPRRRPHVRFVVSPLFALFDKPPGAPCSHSTGFRGFFPFSVIGPSACLRTTPPFWLTCGTGEALIHLSSTRWHRRSCGFARSTGFVWCPISFPGA